MPRDAQFRMPGGKTPPNALPFHRALSLLVIANLLLPSLTAPAMAQALDPGSRAIPVHGQVSISREVSIASATEKVSLNLRDASLRDVLNMLAQQGHFNLILDESVDGTLTVDIKNIPLNKALEYIFTVSQLSYTKDGNTLIVASQETADKRNLSAKTFKAIPVQYKSAAIIASQLNNTILKVQRPGSSTSALVAADTDSNSLLVIGTDADMRLVNDALRELDIPRNRKVYKIKYSTPAYVAQVLSANFFMTNNSNGSSNGSNSGSNGSSVGGNSGGGGSSSGGSSLGGSSGSSGGSGSVGGSSGSSGGGTTGGSSTSGGTTGGSTTGGGTAGSNNNSTGLGMFTVGGVTFVAEPVASTLTVLATDDQLALIDSLIDQVDVRRPQVAIEVSLVEIQDSTLKSLVPTWTPFSFGRLGLLNIFNDPSTGTNNLQLANPFSSKRFQLPNPTTNINSGFALNFKNQNLRGKVLANPTIVTLDNTQANITITDQIPTINQTNTITNGVSVISTTISTQEAGVTVSLTPHIYNDGSVTLNLQPTVSQPVRTISATNSSGTVSTVLLSSRSMNLSGVRVKDGETLVIGGLLRETTQTDINKMPGFDKLPIVSAMFRSTNSNNKDKTELVLMVTPHILKEEAVSYFDQAKSGKFESPNQGQGGMQPVSLPKFIGPAIRDELQQAQPIKPEQSSAVPAEQQSKSKAQASFRPPLKELTLSESGPVGPLQEVALKTRPGNTAPDSPKAITKRVYQQPAPKMPTLDLMDEILKN